MRDGLDGPQHIKSLLKLHLFGIHQNELRVHPLGGRCFPRHFHLHGRTSNPRCFRSVLFGQVNTAAAESATNIQDLAARLETRYPGDMLNELILSRLFCFFATNPIAMMDVRAPQTLVIRACAVVEIHDFLFVVIASHPYVVLLLREIDSFSRLTDCLSYPLRKSLERGAINRLSPLAASKSVHYLSKEMRNCANGEDHPMLCHR